MKDRLFFDTNVIAYAFDKSEPAKRAVCKDLVRRAFDGDVGGSVSNQVLAELFVVLTQKVARPLSRERAGTIVKSFADSASWEKLAYGAGTVARAVDDSVTIPNPFWDLLIAETMREGRVKRIYTENVRDFQDIPWVEPVYPFKAKGPEPGHRGRVREPGARPVPKSEGGSYHDTPSGQAQHRGLARTTTLG